MSLTFFADLDGAGGGLFVDRLCGDCCGGGRGGVFFFRSLFGDEAAVAADQPVSGILLDPVLELLFLLVAFAAALAGFDVFLGFPTGNEAGFLGGLFLFLSDLLFDLVDLFFLLFFFEVIVVPELGLIEDAFGYIARVEDDLVNPRFEVGLTQVGVLAVCNA